MILKSPEVFIINLKYATDRWKKITANCESIGQEYKRFEAVDGSTLCLPTTINDKNYDNGKISQYHLACALSHIQLWELILNSNIEYACILEDDAILNKKIENIRTPGYFDILYLTRRASCGYDNDIPPGLWPKVFGGCGTEGYIVSRNGIRKLLKITEDIDKPLDLRIIYHLKGLRDRNPPMYSLKNKFVSRRYPDIVLDGYRSNSIYIEHDDSAPSCINVKAV